MLWSARKGSGSQRVKIFAGNDPTCSGTAAQSFDLSGNVSSLLWNRFETATKGLLRFSIETLSNGVPSAPASCSGNVFLRNGVLSSVGTSTGMEMGYFNGLDGPVYGDVNGDGVLDVISSNSTYNSSSGLIAVYASVSGSLTRRQTSLFYGSTGDGLGSTIEVEDITGDGIVDIVSGSNTAVSVIPGSLNLPASATVGTDYGRRYYASFIPNLMSTGQCVPDKFLFGDLTGDGLSDIIACAGFSSIGFSQAGAILVIPTGASLPGSGDVEALPAVRIYTGSAANMNLGLSTGIGFHLGDLNNDGFQDILYSSWFSRSYVVIPGGSTLPASGVAASVGREWTDATFGQVGLVAFVGDPNNDGIDDWILTPDGLYIVYGQGVLPANGTIQARASRIFTSSSYLYAVLRDLNGDSVSDLVVSAPEETVAAKAQAGSIYVLLGGAIPASAAISGVAHRRYDGEHVSDNLGVNVNTAYFQSSDVNGDGYTDLVFSNQNTSPGGLATAGSAYLLWGGSPLAANGFISSSGVRYDGAFAGDSLNIENVVDLNGDGNSDLVLRRNQDTLVNHRALIDLVFTTPAHPPSGSITARASRTYEAGPLYENFFGDIQNLDFNADGYLDLKIAMDSSPIHNYAGGACFIGGGAVWPASGLMANAGTCFYGDAENEYYTLTRTASVNGDAYDDFMINRGGTGLSQNSLQLVLGAATFPSFQRASGSSATWGDPNVPVRFATSRDLNSDSIPELIYLQPSASTNGFSSNGALHLIPGGHLYSTSTP